MASLEGAVPRFPRPASPTLDRANDGELMRAVARQRDGSAFEELYRRHARLAFAVAYHVSGNREVAEEAVQQGMVRIWNRAAHFDPARNLRAWIGRVVTREALNILRARRKYSRREFELPDRVARDLAASRLQEQGADWVSEFHQVFNELPPLERQLLTMYYAAGMTQIEMARALALPQRTVSHKLEAALQVLRTGLTRAGFAAALPASMAEAFCTVLASGGQVSPSLCQKVLGSLDRAPVAGRSQAAALPRRAVGSAGIQALVATGALLSVSIAVAGWWASGTPGGETRSVAAGGEGERVPPSRRPAVPEDSSGPHLYRRWTFESGPATDLLEFSERKKWRWRPGRQGNAEMYVEGLLPGDGLVARRSALVHILLPQQLPRAPFAVTAEVQLPEHQPGHFGLDGNWTDLRGDLPYRRWRAITETRHRINRIAVHFVGPYVIQRVNGLTVTLSEYGAPYPAKRVLLALERITVTALELRMLRPDEGHQDLRDLPRTIRSLGLKPSEIPLTPYSPPGSSVAEHIEPQPASCTEAPPPKIR